MTSKFEHQDTAWSFSVSRPASQPQHGQKAERRVMRAPEKPRLTRPPGH